MDLVRKLFGGGKKNYTDLNGKLFEEYIKNDPDAIVIDVRTHGEYYNGHLPGAINIDVMGNNFVNEVEKMNLQRSYYLYCRSGARSRAAASRMGALGFGNVFNLAGGMASDKAKAI